MDFTTPDDLECPRPDFRSACFDLTQAQRARVMTAMMFLLRGGPILFRIGNDKRQVYLDPGDPGGTYILGEVVHGKPEPGQPDTELVPLGFELNLYSFVRYVAFLMPDDDFVRLSASLVLDKAEPPDRVAPDDLM